MADFSKQWVDQIDSDLPYDFDILQEAEGLKPGTHIDIVCEGYGFNAIAKDERNNILLAFHNWQDGTTKWVPYNQIVK